MATDSPKRSRRKRSRRRSSTEEQRKVLLKAEQDSIVMWKKPFTTLWVVLTSPKWVVTFEFHWIARSPGLGVVFKMVNYNNNTNSNNNSNSTFILSSPFPFPLSSPFSSRYYFILECLLLTREYTLKLLNNLAILIPVIILVVSLYGLTLVEGRHQFYIQVLKKEALWCGYWVGLGKSKTHIIRA